MSEQNYRIAVVDRALDALEALAEARGPVGVSDIARTIGATKSAVFRILVNLERRGYVLRDPTSSKYQLGGRLVQLGYHALATFDVRERARPVLEALHERFNETVNLAIPVNGRLLYIDMIESEHGLRMAARIGATDEMHSTALGKAILSFLPEEQREQVLRSPLAKRTAQTNTDPASLRQELERIRASGVAEDHGENEPGACCYGSPIFDHAGNVTAAVSISAPERRLRGEVAEEVRQAVLAAAQDITDRIGGRWPPMSSQGSENG